MSGLARFFQKRIGGEYVAGLWSNALVEGLVWWTEYTGARIPFECYTGPSWSWAAYNGTTLSLTATGQCCENVAVVKAWHVELINQSNLYGAVKEAWLQVHGPLVRVAASSVQASEKEEEKCRKRQRSALPQAWCRVCTSYSESRKGSVLWMDYPQRSMGEVLKQQDPHVLILGRIRADRGMNSNWGVISSNQGLVWGLVISTNDRNPGNWRRIGWMYLPGEEGRKIIDVEDNWKTVTLV